MSARLNRSLGNSCCIKTVQRSTALTKDLGDFRDYFYHAGIYLNPSQPPLTSSVAAHSAGGAVGGGVDLVFSDLEMSLGSWIK